MNHPLATPPWGPWIGVYILLTGLASGLTLVTRFVRPVDERAAARVDWIASWSALATLGVCAIILSCDLGRPGRFFLMVTQFANMGSLMSWGAKIIALKIALLAVHLALLHRRRHALAIGDATLTGTATRAVYVVIPEVLALVSFALAIYPAFLLSWTWSSPAAHNAGAALVYLSSAVILGVAATSLVMVLAPAVDDPAVAARLRAGMMRVLAAHMVALGFVAVSLRSNETRAVYDELVHGPLAAICWVLVIASAAGIALSAPALGARSRIALSVAALVTAATSRYLIFAVN